MKFMIDIIFYIPCLITDTIDYIKKDSTYLEQEPFKRATKNKQLLAFKHKGFWQCMDTLRDKEILENRIKELTHLE